MNKQQMESVLEALQLAFEALTEELSEREKIEAKGAVAISIMSMRSHLAQKETK